MEEPNGKSAIKHPKDPWHLVYIIFYWLGIGSLLPWNFFITVNAYWMYKFRDTGLETVSNMNETITDELITDEHSAKLAPLQIEWGSNLSIASMIPNVTFLLLNAVFGHRFKTFPRLVVALVMVILLFVFSTVMTRTDTDSWQKMFLAVTLFSVVLINICVAIFQGGLAGLAGHFPPRYMGSMVQGQAVGGIFAAATNVVLLALGANEVAAAFYCFLVAVIFLSTALVAFFVLTRSEFFQFYANGHHHQDEAPENDQLINNENTQQQQAKPKVNIMFILSRIWVHALAVFLSFFVTLAVFPSITALVRSTDYGNGHEWNDKYFIPVSCFLVFNIGDYLGRFLAGLIQWPKSSWAGAWITLAMSISRLAFIPLFLFCNASPENRSVTQVYFPSDAAYIILMCIFSISNGYIGSICMMFAPKMVPDGPQQGTAASLMVSLLVLGLAVGAALSSLFVRLL